MATTTLQEAIDAGLISAALVNSYSTADGRSKTSQDIDKLLKLKHVTDALESRAAGGSMRLGQVQKPI